MLRVLLLGLVTLFGVCRGGVDTGDCHTEHKPYGQTAECEPGYVAHSLCTSGHRADCPGNSHTNLECCRETEVPERTACETLEGGYGSELECRTGQYVKAVCSSGWYDDCGSNVWNRISCCESTQTPNGDCDWRFLTYGELLVCGSSEVIGGVCSSGKNADCRGKHTGVLCCPVKN